MSVNNLSAGLPVKEHDKILSEECSLLVCNSTAAESIVCSETCAFASSTYQKYRMLVSRPYQQLASSTYCI